MIEDKLRVKLLTLLVVAVSVFGLARSQTALSTAPIVTVNGKPMLGGILMIQLRQGADVHHIADLLPAGVELVSQLLTPDRTVLYGGGLRRTSIGQQYRDLLSAEDRLTRSVIVRYAGPILPTAMARQVLKDPNVVVAEPYYVAQEQAVPNDPLFAQQNAMVTMKVAAAWVLHPGDPNVVIAISDNGVDQNHEDLAGSLWTNTGEVPNNMVDDDGNGAVDDYQGYNFAWQDDGTQPGNTANNRSGGHGTKVAGIAGATVNNSKGMAGVAGRCKIFPMKTARADGGGIVYGYQSLIYAAQQGFKVVNCSWGVVKAPSPIDQAVIDYCLANGLVVVSSAGNHGNGSSGDGWDELNFPSAYDGVIGVGETMTNDIATQTSGLGKNAAVMAPGRNAWATTSGGGYTNADTEGTSFAAPMASGIAALVRSKYPDLSPRQVGALLRRTADDISAKNSGLGDMVSGRVNAQRALATDPASTAALRIVETVITHTNGTPADRFEYGDTLLLSVSLINDLATTGEMSYTLSISDGNSWSVAFVKDAATSEPIASGSTRLVGPFKIVVNSFTDLPCIFDLRMADDATYDDDALIYMMPSPIMSTMSNASLVYSVGDDGTFGYSSSLTSRQGIGFNWKPSQALISPSGFLLSEGGTRALKAYNNLTNTSDFTAEKRFIVPDRERGVMSDANVSAPKKIGVRVAQRFTFPSADAAATVISVNIENTTASDLTDLAAGYFLDWDIGYAGQSNTTRSAPEALPVSFREMGAAQLFAREGVPAVVVCAAVSAELSFEPQSAGMMLGQYIDDGDGITDADVIMFLSSGETIQTTQTGDACGVSGMRFPGVTAPGQVRSFMIVIGVGATEEEATTLVRETIEDPSSVAENAGGLFRIAPNPTSDRVEILGIVEPFVWTLVDMMGTVVNGGRVDTSSSLSHVDVTLLPTGRYQLVITDGHGVRSTPLVILR
ncbi:MAG: hypothetical protein EHM43_08155 [Ignavibacteriae bacterium]|nr:MAG: hypothetical protein EHM43_08155 [Ignavibacteriota bacterium]